MSFPKDEKIAALICIVFEIPYEHAKLMAADQVNSLIEWHHCVIPKAEGGPDVHWNAEPMLRAAHPGAHGQDRHSAHCQGQAHSGERARTQAGEVDRPRAAGAEAEMELAARPQAAKPRF
jgi:hypothetical protein